MAAPGSGQPQQVIRAGEDHYDVEGDTDLDITGGAMVMSGGQRLVGPGGQVIVAAPGQQLVRTSGGEVTVLSADHNLLIHHSGQILVQPQQPQTQQTVAQPRPGNIHDMTLLLAMKICPDQKNLDNFSPRL